MITSSQNPKIKRIRLLQSQSRARKEQAVFVLEGIRLLEEALNAGVLPELLLTEPGIDQRAQDLIQGFRGLGVEIEVTTPEIFSSASDTMTPQGVLGVFPQFQLDPPPEPDFLLILDEIRDPGNLGTLLRSAAAAGADCVIVTPGTADYFSPKVTRAAMGAHFHLPILTATLPEIEDHARGMTLYLADMNRGKSCWETDLTQPIGIIIGGEAHGPGQAARRLAEGEIHIPLNQGTESLNAASAGAILLFEVRRQRSSGGPV